jgi:hypothetical protein
LLHVLVRSAKTDVCGRSFAVLSTKVSTAGFRLRHNRLTCGIMLEVSHDAVAAGEEQLVSCTAKQSKYCLICTVSNNPCDDLPLASWGQSIGVRPFRGRAHGDMLEAMARIAPPQPNKPCRVLPPA